MTRPTQNRVATFVLGDQAAPDLDQLVQSVLTLLAKADFQRRGVSFDCEDIAFLDFDAIRVAITVQPPCDGAPMGQIALGVGQVPGEAAKPLVLYEKLADHLSTLVAQAIGATAVLWCHRDGPLTTAVIDDVLEEAIDMRAYLDTQIDQVAEADLSYTASPNHAMSLEEQDARIAAFRDYLVAQQRNRSPAPALHAAIYLIASVLIIMVPPLGATLFTYCLLRDSEGMDLDAIKRRPVWRSRLKETAAPAARTA